MDAEMNDSADAAACWMSTAREFMGLLSSEEVGRLTEHFETHSDKIPTQQGFPAYGGYYREEAILALRRFYITSNTNGTSKASRLRS
jgi:hypothetical protein